MAGTDARMCGISTLRLISPNITLSNGWESAFESDTAVNVVGTLTADNVFCSRTDAPTDADDAPMGMCTVYGSKCSNCPDTSSQWWLFTFFNQNGNGIQFAKKTTQAFVLYMRTKNNSGTSAWKSITFS